MQEKIQIKTKDDHIIYGTLDQSDSKKERLLIFVHGLSGNQREHQYYNAVPFFTEKGFDTFRFDFYSRNEKGRQLSECSLAIHVDDLKNVIERFKDEYKELILVGHSIGALVIFNSDLKDVSKIVLWDPTKGAKDLESKKIEYEPKIDKFILKWGKEILLGKQMIEDWKKAADIKPLIEKIDKPCKFIFAGAYTNYEAWKPFIDGFEVYVVEKAGHQFLEEGCEEKLFEETLRFVG